MRGYKIGVTKSSKTKQLPFKWHRRYYDRVICNAKEYQRVARYIDENIGRWHTQQAENQLHPYHDPLS